MLVCKITAAIWTTDSQGLTESRENSWGLRGPGEAGWEGCRKGRAGEAEDLGYTLG